MRDPRVTIFDICNKVSAESLRDIFRFMEAREPRCKLFPYGTDPEGMSFQWRGIDFGLELFLRRLQIECKADLHVFKNLFMETVSNVAKNTIGCIEKSESDFFFYHMVKSDILLCLPTRELILFFMDAWREFRRKGWKLSSIYTDPRRKGDPNYETQGFPEPIHWVLSSIEDVSLRNPRIWKLADRVNTVLGKEILFSRPVLFPSDVHAVTRRGKSLYISFLDWEKNAKEQFHFDADLILPYDERRPPIGGLHSSSAAYFMQVFPQQNIAYMRTRTEFLKHVEQIPDITRNRWGLTYPLDSRQVVDELGGRVYRLNNQSEKQALLDSLK